jgi:hypothetical protein
MLTMDSKKCKSSIEQYSSEKSTKRKTKKHGIVCRQMQNYELEKDVKKTADWEKAIKEAKVYIGL